MSERSRKRLEELSALRSDDPFDPERFGEKLEVALNAALRHLTGDTDRDIVSVEGTQDEGGAGFVYEGHGEDGTRRFWCVIYFSLESAQLEVNIAITKRKQAASLDCFGQSGPNFGNRAMLARAFDVLISTAIECGVRHLKNTPWDDRVKNIYSAMGFQNGERLDLRSSDHLHLAVDFIEATYDLTAKEHERFTAPW